MFRSKEKIEGIARKISRVSEPSKNPWVVGGMQSGVVMHFRVETPDEEGNIVDTTSVEMRGKEIRGEMVDGDTVRVTKGKVKQGVVLAKEVLNITTNSKVKVKK